MPTGELPSTTRAIVQSLTQAIVEHRLAAGSKLAESKLAAQFGVSRTLVRQALFQLSQQGLIRMEPSRGAYVASPSVDEAREVFAVRRMLEAEMIRALVRQINPAMIEALEQHLQREQGALDAHDTTQSNTLLGDFHVRLAELLGNRVLLHTLSALVARCSLITLMYQPAHEARHAHAEHAAIVQAMAASNALLAVQRMDEHLRHVEAGLELPPR